MATLVTKTKMNQYAGPGVEDPAHRLPAGAADLEIISATGRVVVILVVLLAVQSSSGALLVGASVGDAALSVPDVVRMLMA